MASINDDITDDIIAFSAQLPRLEAGMRRKVRTRLRRLEKKLISELVRIDPSDPARQSFKIKRLQSLLKVIQTEIAATYRSIKNETGRELIKIARLSGQATTQAVNNSVGVALATAGVTEELLEKIVFENVVEGAKSAEWWSRQAGALKFKFQREISEGIQLNETIGDMTRRIRGTRARGFKDGIMSASYKDAESLVRTSVISTSNDSRLEALQANADILDGIRWVSTLDSSTTAICRGLDGLMWDLDYKPINHSTVWPGSTAHWNCRSTQVPVVAAFKDLPKSKRDRIPQGTRASVDGQVPAKQTYDNWLKRKDRTNPGEVKRILGKRKYEIWKSEGLSVRDMVDQYNNPLTVAELEKAYNIN